MRSRNDWQRRADALEIEVSKTRLEGVLLIDTRFFRDERGFFIENYHQQRFAEHGITADFVQDNHSGSNRGVLRGLHYQDMTAPMGKLVRCTAGEIQDVAVDLRVGSPTFGQWVSAELSQQNMRQIWVPPGFGHGFVTLSEYAEVQYKCSGFYTPSSEGTIAWNDPDLKIDWRIPEPQVSQRDRQGMSLAAYLKQPAFHYHAGGLR